MERKSLADMVKEIENIFIKEQSSPREILLILREIESDATVALALQGISIVQSQQKDGVVEAEQKG